MMHPMRLIHLVRMGTATMCKILEKLIIFERLDFAHALGRLSLCQSIGILCTIRTMTVLPTTINMFPLQEGHTIGQLLLQSLKQNTRQRSKSIVARKQVAAAQRKQRQNQLLAEQRQQDLHLEVVSGKEEGCSLVNVVSSS